VQRHHTGAVVAAAHVLALDPDVGHAGAVRHLREQQEAGAGPCVSGVCRFGGGCKEGAGRHSSRDDGLHAAKGGTKHTLTVDTSDHADSRDSYCERQRKRQQHMLQQQLPNEHAETSTCAASTPACSASAQPLQSARVPIQCSLPS
jgi:hypothetical protein